MSIFNQKRIIKVTVCQNFRIKEWDVASPIEFYSAGSAGSGSDIKERGELGSVCDSEEFLVACVTVWLTLVLL